MNAGQLLQHFERISEAPEAIPRLRRFILDLAVRGKLVDQDPSDEPAAELLKRIGAEKARLNRKERSRREMKNLSSDDEPIQLPIGWALAPLADLVTVLNGRAYKQQELLSAGTPVLRVGNLFTSDKWYYSTLELDEDKYCDKGDLIFAWSASFGPFIWDGDKVIYHYHIWKLPLHSEANLSKLYLYNFLLQKTREIKEAGHGISMIHMTKEKMERLQVPLPPLAEQHRIVARVDALMSLCDQLEEAKAEREQCRDSLVAASLQGLNQPAEEEETFREHARFTFTILPRITTRAAHIKQLRQTILNLAVRGKLVAQDPSDEPAECCRERLETYPENWRYPQLDKILQENTRNGYSRKPDEAIDGIPILRISAGTARTDGVVAEEEHKLISGIDEATRLQYGLRAGDLLACRFNGNKAYVGRLTLFSNYLGISPIYPDKLIRVRIEPKYAMPKYVRMAGDSDIVRKDIESCCATTVGNWGISASKLKEIRFPLPPLAEQQRIVAKVDELMAICDQLEAQLTATEKDSRRFLEAVLNEALSPALAKAA